jgi:organic radical activating enzyme
MTTILYDTYWKSRTFVSKIFPLSFKKYFHNFIFPEEDLIPKLKNGKIRLSAVCSNLTYGCNLKCQNCSAMSPYMKGYESREEYLEMCRNWAQRLRPYRFYVAGGEPLLHPEFEEITLKSKEIWKESYTIVVSNGYLLHNLSSSFLKQASIGNIEFRISLHIPGKDELNKLRSQVDILRKYSVKHRFYPSIEMWVERQPIDKKTGWILPVMSNAQNAYKSCTYPICPSLTANRLYYCNTLAMAIHAVKNGYFPNQWDFVKSHEGLSCDNSDETIIKYLLGDSIEMCTICKPENGKLVEPLQISSPELHNAMTYLKNQKIVQTTIQKDEVK